MPEVSARTSRTYSETLALDHALKLVPLCQETVAKGFALITLPKSRKGRVGIDMNTQTVLTNPIWFHAWIQTLFLPTTPNVKVLQHLATRGKIPIDYPAQGNPDSAGVILITNSEREEYVCVVLGPRYSGKNYAHVGQITIYL